MNLGSDSSDLGELAVPDSVQTFAVADAPVALRSAAVDEVPSGNAAGAVPSTGSGYAAPPAGALRAPRVVIGNGRTPGSHTGPGEAALLSLSAGQAPSVPEVVPPAAIEIDIPPLPPPLPPIEQMRPARVLALDAAQFDTVTDPLAGLAGLILIPAVGAALGYRQARAAQAIRESART